jgi:hypothetical protein
MFPKIQKKAEQLRREFGISKTSFADTNSAILV